jgi:hypothetical protein
MPSHALRPRPPHLGISPSEHERFATFHDKASEALKVVRRALGRLAELDAEFVPNLQRTAARFNEFARAGKEEDFARGEPG